VSQQSETPFSAGTQLFTVTNTQAYHYYRLVTDQLTGNGATLSLAEWGIFGTPEGINVTSDGRVGVGVVNPKQALEVAGNAVFGGNISAGNLGMFRNRIINGDMRIDQRNNGVTVTGITNSVPYITDRFSIPLTSHFTISASRDTDCPLGFTNSLQITNGTGVTIAPAQYLHIQHKIEGLNISDFNYGTSYATPIVVSFYAKTSISNSIYAISLRNFNGTRSYVTNFTIQNANIWTYITLTIPGDTAGIWNSNTSTGLILTISLTTGSDFQIIDSNIGIWSSGNYTGFPSNTSFGATTGAIFKFTGVQLEKGTLATPFEFRPYPIELQLCFRYHFQIKRWSDTLPNDAYIGKTNAANGSAAVCEITLPVPMRTTPTILYSNGSTNGTTTTLVESTTNISTDVFAFGTGPSTITFINAPDSGTSVSSLGPTRIRLYMTGTFTAGYSWEMFAFRNINKSFAVTAEL